MAYLRTNHKQTKCDDCRHHRVAIALRICQHCKQTFAPRNALQKWCSTTCRYPTAGQSKPCWTCGNVITDVHGSNCNECAAESRRRKRRAERTRHKGLLRESYSLAEIAERDRNKCQLCGNSVPMQLQVPHPLAPTIDHIVPISHGGDDTRVNVQLSHFHCNVRKGSRGSQQLRLIG